MRLFEWRIVLTRIGSKIFKFRVAVQERQLDASCGTVTLLGEDEFRDTLQTFFIGAINFFAEYEGDHVGVLLDTSRFAKVAEHGTVIARTSFRGTAQLRQNQEWHS